MSTDVQNRENILVVEADPDGTSHLRTNEEIRIIKDARDRSKNRDEFAIEVRTSVTDKHLRQAILDFEPRVIQFCGHGMGANGIVFQNEANNQVHLISTTALAGTFRLAAEHTTCAVFNVCSSEVQANEVAKHIPYAIGMRKPISDRAALKFTAGFWDAYFARRTVPVSFEWGINAIQSAGIPEDSTPSLKVKEPELTQSQVLIGRYCYYNLKEPDIALGKTGFVMRRNDALVFWIRDRATAKDTFVEYTWLNLISFRDRIRVSYYSEWTFAEKKRRGNRRRSGLAIKTVADVTKIRRVGLDGILDTADQGLADRFEEAKRCLVEQFPRADAIWHESENGQLEKTIDYHNAKPASFYAYTKS